MIRLMSAGISGPAVPARADVIFLPKLGWRVAGVSANNFHAEDEALSAFPAF